MEHLRTQLRQLDRRSFKAYKQLKGSYRFPDFLLTIDHVQGDPFAAPSRVSIRLSMDRAGYPAQLRSPWIRRIALEDYLGRSLRHVISKVVKGSRGSGKSGLVSIETSGQVVLPRNAVLVSEDSVEARITVGLPAAGRGILAREAEAIFFQEIPALVEKGLLFENLVKAAVERHVKTVEDQDMLRNQLVSHRLVGFVADGSILPRKSGIDDHPLTDDPLLFHAPDSLSHTLQLTDSTPVRGLGIPQGVTLIVGGGFHGKSTLLNALEMGVYNHVPDDGRERAVTLSAAVKVRAEDNRSIAHVDIRPFIDRLPRGRDTRRFTTENASGSTSQAANIVEAVETGSRLLLIDEDTSATNFMIRDRRMQALVAPEKEPITPFLYRVRELYEEHGVSSVIVMGGSGDFFEVADTVIMLDNYTSLDATLQARELAGTEVRDSRRSALPPLHSKSSRRPDSNTIDASQGHRETKIDAREVRDLIYGTHSIDLSRVEQLSDIGQTRAIGWMIHYYASHYGDTGQDLISGLEQLLRDVEERGLDILQPYKTGTLALPRLQEVAAAINRMRGVSWN